MTGLFTPATMKSVTLANRIVVSPMCQYQAVNGCATAWHTVHLGTLAISGAGMVIIEATAIEPAGRITPGDLGLYDDATEAALKGALEALRAVNDTAVFIQLGHAGRKASSHLPWEGGEQLALDNGGWETFAPSAIAFKSGTRAPTALDEAGLKRIRDGFVAAAERAARLGIDGIELHGAHGYLLHEFLSPLSNQRSDQYGGSLENRMRFPLEIYDAVRAVFPADKPVGMRVSASDWMENGWDLEQTIALAQELEKRGCDFIDVSSGGLVPEQKITIGPGYQVPFAEGVKAAVSDMAVFSVGLITEAGQADAIIAQEKADFIALGRAILYDPRWPWHAAATLGQTIDAPPSYWRGLPAEHSRLFANSNAARGV
ncbi:NADH:flavin oxidoreductase/NADH oxidase [Rhizobium halophytocola]|uniref:NADPH2 dehydrogenase n=1 Tax=Rhizobium halophytocola TaxID=735519 RepID=A0ABS4DU78_9HYPH|nr:NADH:flavin oxidoreductase/NADH oxidase [Rhizobium halophytocola]MBP1849253.1 NADPH2 dehydrogenase [Rhizobium halophytocola]